MPPFASTLRFRTLGGESTILASKGFGENPGVVLWSRRPASIPEHAGRLHHKQTHPLTAP